ncbi:hypothetical protein XELAEV_18031472mg [Xenopus laevis]|uniref:Uncharacterized protein n=1 Tax=Xenopus laevis TaxID=8355 RepID=A0A974HG28_XENLA|nr:hypothetical protein XELAEV_18031472mg [Xenopus laevis]
MEQLVNGCESRSWMWELLYFSPAECTEISMFGSDRLLETFLHKLSSVVIFLLLENPFDLKINVEWSAFMMQIPV